MKALQICVCVCVLYFQMQLYVQELTASNTWTITGWPICRSSVWKLLHWICLQCGLCRINLLSDCVRCCQVFIDIHCSV